MADNRSRPPLKQFLTLLVLVAILVIGAKYFSQKRPEANVNTPSNTSKSDSKDEVTPTDATQVTISTDKGDIVIALYAKDAPKTTKNFASLAKRGYYNGLKFHRVEPGFVIQGGDPKGDGTGGESIYGPTFEDELNPDTASYKEGYKKGVVAMANRGPNTNGSQFFIMLDDNPQLPKNYTIFGHVVSGQDVVDKIAVGDVMKTVTVKE